MLLTVYGLNGLRVQRLYIKLHLTSWIILSICRIPFKMESSHISITEILLYRHLLWSFDTLKILWDLMMWHNLLIVFSFRVQKALVSLRVSYLLQHLLLFSFGYFTAEDKLFFFFAMLTNCSCQNQNIYT